jgi:hypothetical protein
MLQSITTPGLTSVNGLVHTVCFSDALRKSNPSFQHPVDLRIAISSETRGHSIRKKVSKQIHNVIEELQQKIEK